MLEASRLVYRLNLGSGRVVWRRSKTEGVYWNISWDERGGSCRSPSAQCPGLGIFVFAKFRKTGVS